MSRYVCNQLVNLLYPSQNPCLTLLRQPRKPPVDCPIERGVAPGSPPGAVGPVREVRLTQYIADDRVKGLREELAQEFSSVLSPGAVDDCLSDSLAAFKDARIPDYLPLFVQRDARDRLRRIASEAQ
jgi:hypothetical protein